MGPRTGTETDGATALTAQPAEDMDQRRNSFATIQHHCKRKMEEGDTWYVLGCDWWKKLEEYSQDEGAPHPGPIDNSALLLHPGSSRLKEHISERNDYTFIHEDGWELIARRFSLTQDSVPLPRPVYLTGLFSKAARVELRLLEIRLALYSKPSNVRELDISRGSSFETFLKKVQELFSLDSLEKVRFFIVHEDKKYELVDIKKERDKAAKSSSVLTVDGTSLFHSGMLLHLDVQDEQGNWAVPSRYYAAKNEEDGTLTGTENHPPSSNPIAIPLPSTSSAPHLHGSSSFTRSGMSYGAGSSDFLPGRFNTQTAPGLCGLQNLGNTCFMNSALQCLSNCPPLTDYFLSEDWGSDVNEANPLGMGGRIAKAYANLVRQLWSGTASSFIPRDFKYTVGQFAPQFSGYQQQDSQELLSFLLDGLHEDLNRIRDKPYVELKDADGRPDEVVAPEAWSDYKKRNDSVITDLFHGLLKSKLVCPVCDKVSVKFDPFCYLAIPLPVKKERQVSVTLVSALPDFTWTKYKVAIPKWNGKAFDLLEGLSKITGVETKCLVLAELYESRVRSFFRPFDILLDNHVSERDNLYAFAVSEEEAAYPVTVCVYQRCPRQYERLSPSSEWTLTASPIVFKMPDGFTSAQLHGAVEARARRVFPNLPSLNDPWPVPKQGSPDGDDSGVDDAEGSSGNDSHTGSPMDTDDPVSSANNKRQLYRLRKVNSFGTNVLNSGDVELPRVGPESEEILVSLLSHPMYFAVDWDMEAFSTFVATTSLNVEQHESFRAVTTRKAIQLTDCLRLFSEQEKLGKDDLWYCPDCKEHREATKEMGLWTAPRFLIIHLKRFSYTRTLRDKIEAFVDFPIRGLDMGPYILSNSGGDPILYDLVAVSNHMGGLGGGHYTAYGLNKNNRRWYNFDDSHVSPCSEDSVQSKMAYVLVYMQRAVITPGADPNVELECEDMDE